FYIIYIGIRCGLQPHMGPPVPPEERFNWREIILTPPKTKVIGSPAAMPNITAVIISMVISWILMSAVSQ
ncbi:unnamed protein product, partial [marine sediment metagenome]